MKRAPAPHRASSLAAIVTATAAAALASAAGCVGIVGDPGASSVGPGPGGGDGGTIRLPDGAVTTPFAPAPARLRRLTVAQYQNSLRDLLGATIRVPTDLEADTALNGFASIGAGRITISPHAVEQFETAALDVAHQVLSDTARRGTLVPCTPANTTDAACARTALARFMPRAWRRPVTDDEVNRFVAVGTGAAMTLNSFWDGMEFAIAGVLQSPNFLFRVELGEPDPANPSRHRYDNYEMATRLSYLFWNSTPDDELLAAAGRGELVTAAGVRAQAQRLLAAPRARPAVGNFFNELFDLDTLDSLVRDNRVFSQFTATLGAAMHQETLRAIDDLVFGRDADWRELFDSRVTFVNAELASLYGLPAPPTGTDFVRVELPDSGARGVARAGRDSRPQRAHHRELAHAARPVHPPGADVPGDPAAAAQRLHHPARPGHGRHDAPAIGGAP